MSHHPRTIHVSYFLKIRTPPKQSLCRGSARPELSYCARRNNPYGGVATSYKNIHRLKEPWALFLAPVLPGRLAAAEQRGKSSACARDKSLSAQLGLADILGVFRSGVSFFSLSLSP